MNNKSILLLGGDERQKELYYILKKEFNRVYTFGIFDNENLLEYYDIIVFPYPVSKDNIYLNAPFLKEKILLNNLKPLFNKKTKIFGGKIPKIDFINNSFIFDYDKCDSITIYNAALTAEAAISIAISSSKKAIFKSNVLVCGFGRIGKFLSLYLNSLGANVSVAARKSKDICYINSLKYNALTYDKLGEKIDGFDFVFNTVPATIFNENNLKKASNNTLFIDLASSPGGFDKNIKENHFNIINALSLPGKFSPKSAAEIIYNTIRPYF